MSGADFARQIGWLERHGFHAVTLRDAYLHWRFGRSVPAHPVVVTFDDGYHSQFATAAPILRSHGWVGVLNLEVRNTSALVGAVGEAGQAPDRGRLGARRPHADASRPDAARRRRAAARGSRLTRRRSARCSACRSTSSVTRPGGSTTRSSPRCERPGTSVRRRPRRASRRRPTCSGSTACGSTGATASTVSPRSSSAAGALSG